MPQQITALYQLYLQHNNITTDTRNITPGDLFFALKGDNFNGNLFAKQAIKLGAAYAIVDEPINDVDPQKLFIVTNVLTTLQQLAAHHRATFNIPFIAITGSNGKTTTKELMHAVLSTTYKTYTTQGNLNNHIGVPLTILKIKANAQIAIIEMGANHQNEIESYCQYAKPNYGIINNCGKAHLEGFGGVAGIRKGKGELYNYIKTHGGTIFKNDDYEYLTPMSAGIKNIVSYGTNATFTNGSIIAAEPFLSMSLSTQTHALNITTQLVGDYNAANILAAVCIGSYFNIMPAQIKHALENYTPTNSRSQLITKNGYKIILDAYNANPSSMQVAIENFAKINAPYKIAMLGAMKEMGADEQLEHQNLINLIATKNFNKVLLTGTEFLNCTHTFAYANNSAEAKTWLQAQQIPANTLILVKGSRGIAMEKAIDF